MRIRTRYDSRFAGPATASRPSNTHMAGAGVTPAIAPDDDAAARNQSCNLGETTCSQEGLGNRGRKIWFCEPEAARTTRTSRLFSRAHRQGTIHRTPGCFRIPIILCLGRDRGSWYSTWRTAGPQPNRYDGLTRQRYRLCPTLMCGLPTRATPPKNPEVST